MSVKEEQWCPICGLRFKHPKHRRGCPPERLKRIERRQERAGRRRPPPSFSDRLRYGFGLIQRD